MSISMGEMYFLGWPLIFDAEVLLMLVIGVLAGILIGIVPGLGPTMAVAILTPFTFGMSPIAAMALMMGVLNAGNYGGALAATLCNIPGCPVNMMTCLDGYPMGQKGLAGKAIGIATIGSCIGGLVAAVVLSCAAPIIASAALKFSAPEYFAVCFFGVSCIAYVSPGNMAKGMIAGFIGLMLGVVGPDPLTAFPRFTFKTFQLYSGIQYLPVMIGLFGVAEILRSTQRHEINKNIQVETKIGRVIPTKKELLELLPSYARGSIIGTLVGIMPAAGGTISSIISYGVEKRISRDSSSFGTGNPRGIAAPEASSNACGAGSMIPLLTLGIPGDPGTAALMGVFLIHGLALGPTLFTKEAASVSAIFILLVMATLLFNLFGLTFAKQFAKVITLPMGLLMPIIGLICCVGAFSVNNQTFDFIFLLGFAVIGFLFSKGGVPAAPIVLGLVLGNLVESNFRRSLILTRGNIWEIFSRPIAGTFLILTLLMLFAPPIITTVIKHIKKKA